MYKNELVFQMLLHYKPSIISKKAVHVIYIYLNYLVDLEKRGSLSSTKNNLKNSFIRSLWINIGENSSMQKVAGMLCAAWLKCTRFVSCVLHITLLRKHLYIFMQIWSLITGIPIYLISDTVRQNQNRRVLLWFDFFRHDFWLRTLYFIWHYVQGRILFTVDRRKECILIWRDT